MYVHAHLRWCEAMAHWGDPDALWLGLLQVLPPATVDVVPGARRRQANAYPSSSDAACLDRAEFAARYAEVLTGATGLEAGWRIYSSGPGVLLRIVVHSMLGIRRRAGKVEIDPVLPAQLDGLTATVPLAGGLLRVRYRVGRRGHGPSAVRLGGRELAATRTANPYRVGGLVVDLADLAPGPATGRRRARDPPAVKPTDHDRRASTATRHDPRRRPKGPRMTTPGPHRPRMTSPEGVAVPRPQRQRRDGPLRGPASRRRRAGRRPPLPAVARGEGRA